MSLTWVEDNYLDEASPRIIDLERFLGLRVTDTEWVVEIELRRAHTTTKYGYTMRTPRRFTTEECHTAYSQGRSVPLDLVPWDYWANFDERSLGAKF